MPHKRGESATNPSAVLGVLETDLAGKNAAFATPSILVQFIAWADKLLTE
jgi:hypothetical protein